MNWSTESKDPQGREPVRNVVRKKPGPVGEARHVTTPFEEWVLFLDVATLERILEYTNNNIFEFRETFAEMFDSESNENSDK